MIKGERYAIGSMHEIRQGQSQKKPEPGVSSLQPIPPPPGLSLANTMRQQIGRQGGSGLRLLGISIYLQAA